MEYIQLLKNIIICAVILVIIDVPYLTITKNLYLAATKNISGKDYAMRYYSAIIVYIAIALGIVILVLPKVSKSSKWTETLMQSALYGGVFGFSSYAIFDFTMHFMFDGWTLGLSILDSVWGGILCTLVTFIMVWFVKA
jgi:uncharacterized membrane protein